MGVSNESSPVEESYDIVIVGAGISGINCAYRLQTRLPDVKFTILEGRSQIGGTWDLFKYPGIRSDSDLHTFGFAWHPWPHEKPIAEGKLIMSYLNECVSTYALDRYMNFNHRVLQADWSSLDRRWKVTVDHQGQRKTYISKFVVVGAGYYDYEKPLDTLIPGLENFKGKVIHPQFWPTDYDYTGKNMTVIGSGATAITLIPALAEKAGKVTMLQRSATYILPQPSTWPGPKWIRTYGPKKILAFLERLYYMAFGNLLNIMCRNYPGLMRSWLKALALQHLPERIPYDPHFKPKYNPWDQRLCLCPDADFYVSLHKPHVNVVTSTIETVTEDGIKLKNGSTLDTEVIVTATGLKMRFAGGIPLTVDGELVKVHEKLLWNGAMIQDVPNLMFMVGYTDASWTMGADDTAFILIRTLKMMHQKGVRTAIATTPREYETTRIPHWKLKSTYVQAAEKWLPKYGDKGPWRPRNGVVKDYLHARWGNIDRGLQLLA